MFKLVNFSWYSLIKFSDWLQRGISLIPDIKVFDFSDITSVWNEKLTLSRGHEELKVLVPNKIPKATLV